MCPLAPLSGGKCEAEHTARLLVADVRMRQRGHLAHLSAAFVFVRGGRKSDGHRSHAGNQPPTLLQPQLAPLPPTCLLFFPTAGADLPGADGGRCLFGVEGEQLGSFVLGPELLSGLQ